MGEDPFDALIKTFERVIDLLNKSYVEACRLDIELDKLLEKAKLTEKQKDRLEPLVEQFKEACELLA